MGIFLFPAVIGSTILILAAFRIDRSSSASRARRARRKRRRRRKKTQSQTMVQSQYPQSSHDTTFDEGIFWCGQPMANDMLFKWESIAEERSDPASVRLWVEDLHIPRLWRSCVRATAVIRYVGRYLYPNGSARTGYCLLETAPITPGSPPRYLRARSTYWARSKCVTTYAERGEDTL